MNLVKILMREHSRATCQRIVAYIGTDKKRFGYLINVFFNGTYRLSQRASWPLSFCIEQHPKLVKPHLKKLISGLKKPDLSDASKRNKLRLLQFVSVPRPLQGITSQICFDFLQNRKEPIAVRVFSMTVLANLVEKQPGLKSELRIIIEDELPYGSAGFLSRGKKLLKRLKD